MTKHVIVILSLLLLLLLLLILFLSWVSLRECAPRRRTAQRRSSCSRRRTATLTPRGQTLRNAPVFEQKESPGEKNQGKRPFRELHCIHCRVVDNGTGLSFNKVSVFCLVMLCLCQKRSSTCCTLVTDELLQ